MTPAQPATRIHLDAAGTRTVTVEAAKKNNDAGLDVKRGEVYAIEANGTWFDTKKHPAGPDGYDSDNIILRKSESHRRVPSARWFALIASVDGDDHGAKAIGAKGSFEPPADGRLTLFANDVSFMYWNNSGSITVTITRTR